MRRIVGEQVGRDLFSDIAVEALNMMTGQTLYQRIDSSIENTVDGLWPIQQLPKVDTICLNGARNKALLRHIRLM